MRWSAIIALFVVAIMAVSACTWIATGPEARQVRVVTAEEAADCEYIGITRVATVATLGLFDRYQKSIEEELCALARNSAVGMGGDSIVPIGGIVDGQRSYRVYRCLST